MKKSISKTKKKTPELAFVVNLTNAETPQEIYAEYGYAKQRAGLPITKDELTAIMFDAAMTGIAVLAEVASSHPSKTIEIKNGEKLVFDENGKWKVKKPNIFRRFWNWITRKK